MSDIIQPGGGLVFMKVGTHAQEPLDEIIARKQREIDEAGMALWGYGGNTCHPVTMVQPFAKSFEKKGSAIYLCMEEMESRHYAEPKRAEQMSENGLDWTDIASSINVLGSRFALVIKELKKEAFELPLANTRVAVGNQRGRAGNLYVNGRVDKACLEYFGEPDGIVDGPLGPDAGTRTTRIGLVAKLEPPYAVFLRNRP